MHHALYRAGVVINIWLLGCMCGVTLYAVIRFSEQNEREYAKPQLPARELTNYRIDAGCYAPAIGEVD